MNSDDHVLAARRELERGMRDRAVRELETALTCDSDSQSARELLLEAHRCRNGVYWIARGYWCWEGRTIARWVALPMFVGSLLLAVGAQCFGGYRVFERLPVLSEPNIAARFAQIAALCVVVAFVSTRGGETRWVIDRVATSWLVPASVRERCLDGTEITEHRRAAGYALGFVSLCVAVALGVVLTTFTDLRDDVCVAALALSLPFGLAIALPPSRARTIALFALVLAGAGSAVESMRTPDSPRTDSSLGIVTAAMFLLALAVTPILIALHSRAARTPNSALAPTQPKHNRSAFH